MAASGDVGSSRTAVLFGGAAATRRCFPLLYQCRGSSHLAAISRSSNLCSGGLTVNSFLLAAELRFGGQRTFLRRRSAIIDGFGRYSRHIRPIFAKLRGLRSEID